MRRFKLPVILTLILSGLLLFVSPQIADSKTPWAQNKRLAINSIKPNTETVGLYELFELSIDLSATLDNPFDPEELDLTAHITSPSGKNIVMPGFFMQDYTLLNKSGREVLEPKGEPLWKIRFAPLELGEYRYYIVARDKKRYVKSDERRLKVVESSNPGFLRRSEKAPHYLEFDSGKSYIGIGQSIGWARASKHIYDYDYYFTEMAKNGCNYSRMWMVPWNLAIEWTNKGYKVGDFDGVGIYNLENAWKIDSIFNIAKEKGIYFMLTMGNYGDFMAEQGPWNEQNWENNPYNKINGGFCRNPRDFFSNEQAKNYYKKRLRYIIARWGYATNLLSLEFLNEYKAPIDWVKEMGKFIKENDPHRHLITLSANYYPPKLVYSEDELWNLDEIDLTQIHLYGYKGAPIDLMGDLTSKIINLVMSHPKPCLVAEFGIDSSKDDRFYDREGKGVNLHNGLWGAIFSGSFAGAANWWWDSYVKPKNLYHHYKALANFVSGVDWTKEDWNIIKTSQPKKFLKAGEGIESGDLVLSLTGEWGEISGKELTVKNTGEVIGGKINRYLQGIYKKDVRITPSFKVNYPRDGKFVLTIGTVSAEGDIHVYIDDKEVWRKKFPTGPEGEGEWVKSKWQKQWQIWHSTYDKDYEIKIPKGEHTIRLENKGKDWILIKKITLTNYKSSMYPDVRVVGLIRKDEALLWIQNIESNWYTNSIGIDPTPQKDIYFTVFDIPDGNYELEWWDTWEGKVINETDGIAKNGTLLVQLSELKTDIAVKIRKK